MRDITAIDWSRRYRGHTTLGRFMSKIDRRDASGCWHWSAALSSTGYGVFRVQGTAVLAHRTMFALWYGYTDHELDHICRAPRCVNPDHLEPVSHWENNARSSSPSAERLRADHCINGHPWVAENTGVGMRGSRRCKTCHRAAEADRRVRRIQEQAR